MFCPKNYWSARILAAAAAWGTVGFAGILCLLLSAAAVEAATPTAATFQMRSATVNNTTYIFLADLARYYGMQHQQRGELEIISSRYSELQFQQHRRRIVVNGVVMHLSHAPARWQQNLMISATDFRLLLEPVLRIDAVPAARVHTIVIDPGHGGRDPGARGAIIAEKDLTLQLALQLRDLLQQHGYRVFLTRSNDRTLSLSERVDIARQRQPDLFISIHANATTSASVAGVETFIFPPHGTEATHGGKQHAEVMAVNSFDRQNTRLAFEIQRSVIAQTGSVDRGVKHANFLVLREAPCPAVLLEVGFLSNAAEERRLVNAAYQQRLVRAIADAIILYQRCLSRQR